MAKENKTIDNEEEVQTEAPQPSQQDQTKGLGQNLLYFLNKPGCAPAMSEETQHEHQVWHDLCLLAMQIKSGKVGLTKLEE